MKVYVVTSLIENADIGAEVNVISIEKNKQNAFLKLIELLKEAKKEYEENDIDYTITSNDNCVILQSNNDFEILTFEYQESEVN